VTSRVLTLAVATVALTACAEDRPIAAPAAPFGPPVVWSGPSMPQSGAVAPPAPNPGVPVLTPAAAPPRAPLPLAALPQSQLQPPSLAVPTIAPTLEQASQSRALRGWGTAPAPLVDPRRFTEAHWQGLEVIPNTPAIRRALGITAEKGVIIDDVTLPADLQGFSAGGLVVAVGQVPTPDLLSFIRATERVADRRRAEVQVIERGASTTRVVTALMTKLGIANGETPSMIPPGARMPHPYRGACTHCHRIGTTGTLMVDQGDLTTTAAPPIRAGSRRPHRDRGACQVCHTVQP